MSNMAIIGGRRVHAPEGIRWRNYEDDEFIQPLKSRPRRRWHGPAPKQIVVHESVTSTWEGAVNVLTRRHLGIQVMIHKDGTVSQHADLLRLCPHAGAGRNNSVGIEIVNRYYGKYAKPGDKTIKAPWAHKCPRS